MNVGAASGLAGAGGCRAALLGTGNDLPRESRLWLRSHARSSKPSRPVEADGWALAPVSEAMAAGSRAPVAADSRAVSRRGNGGGPGASGAGPGARRGRATGPDGAPPLVAAGRRPIPSRASVDAAVGLAVWRRDLAGMAAGPELAATLACRPAPAGSLTARGGERRALALVDSLVARQRLMAHLQAEQLADLAELSGGYPGLREFLPTEIALALGVAQTTAGRYLDEATETLQRLPATFAALHAGRITPVKAATIRTHTRDLEPGVAALVEGDVLGRAGRQTVPQLREALQRAVLRRDPAGAALRHESATARRHIGVHPKPDGMAGLWAFGPADQVAVVHDCLFAMGRAARTPGDTRTPDARAFDALVDLCTGILDSGSWRGTDLPKRRSARPHIQVTMPITALLGADDVCELAGYGPISAAQARRIAADGQLRRLVCDPLSGMLLDYGRTRYRPPDDLARYVQARDATCDMPGCRQPAHRNPIDHIRPFRPGQPSGGSTAGDNLAAPCEHHHRAKDGGGFAVARHGDGSYTWTTPLGYVYRREATRIWNLDEGPPSTPDSASRTGTSTPTTAPPNDPPPF